MPKSPPVRRAPRASRTRREGPASPRRILGAELLTSASARSGFPPGEAPEIAFLGRSNVGKSSLLNRLVERRGLARTSKTPGRTQLVNFFRVRRASGELVLVDLPGYGWARVSKKERQAWQGLVEAYLGERRVLRLAILLHDARRDPGPDERDLLPWLAERGVPVVGVLTKLDRLSARERSARLRAFADAGLPIEWLPTSSKTGHGIDAVWDAIEAHLP